ncbi:MAG TPA: hypothetical protein VF440_04610 [Novosphingobium sp.]
MRQAGIVCAVTPKLTAAFNRTVSPERWRTYQRVGGFHEDLAHRLYVWNAAIGQSFHFPLQTVEVALRNVVHQALCNLYGANWSSDSTCRNMLRPKQVDDITKAERRHYSIHQQTASTPQIVASLSLGFWVAMMRREYNRTIWATQTRHAFPHLSAPTTIVDVSRTATRVQDLRNRIFHQEPLIGHNLSQDYGNIVALLGWICPETRDWMRSYSSVPTVMRERPR